ncbi:MAG: tetratricopeptide repeat protein [Candidatus Omnitrophica bacterium]|nr:tetratricopeptide repeat protein [Candidatus Omnitrophota bacterium]
MKNELKANSLKLKVKTKSLKFLVLSCSLTLCALSFALTGFAQEEAKPASGELIVKAWEVHGKKDVEQTFQYTQQLIDLYKDEADKQQVSLKVLPKSRNEIEAMQILNDVGTAYFIQGESYRNQGNNEEAIRAFKVVVDRYYYAQAWDPRGWFWSVSRASRESILKLNPDEPVRAPLPFEVPPEKLTKKQVSQITTKIALYDSGKEDFVNYEKYGEFQNTGTKDYKYDIKDQEGLSAAVGEGIYPNSTSMRWDPEFKKAQQEKRLEGSHWDFVHSPDLEAAFLKWATASEPQGVKLFYTGLILEKSGLIKQAIKCYYAIVVHFPGSYGWTYWHTPWYVGQAAISKIKFLLRRNPELGYKLVDADIRITNGYDNDLSNDVVIAKPGRFVKLSFFEKFKFRPYKALLSIKRSLPRPSSNAIHDLKEGRGLGRGKVHLIQYESGDWQLIVDNKPYVIRGITYSPTKVGESPDEHTQTNWMENDFNNNGKIDGPYDTFVDKNKNNKQDPSEPAVGDFDLMKKMGVNTIRLYHQPFKPDKKILRDLYNNYGIRVIMGDFFGKYALGSGAPWYPGTDYNNEGHKKNMMESVTNMVLEFKDEPYILFWLLGNENVYGIASNADKEPEDFFKFANEAASYIKSIDPQHPVAICSGDTLFLDKFGKNAPDIDIFGTNAYRGDYGFGYLWQQVKEEADLPVFITEFGCPSYAEGKTPDETEHQQAEYHRGSWEDIEYNMAFSGGMGNSIGGVVFEWLDEWWKAYEPRTHDTKGLFTGPFPDGYMHEEWLGLCSQGDGKLSPFLRQLRKAYFMYQKMWK